MMKTMFRNGRARLATALVFAALGGVGCMHPGPQDAARVGPFFTPKNVVGDASIGSVRRVVLLPVWSGSVAPVETAADLDIVFTRALQQQNRFEVVTFSRADCQRLFRAPSVSASAALPHDLLAKLKREFAADAVMFVDLTVYQAYRPLALGIRAKLAAIDGSRLVWSFDDLFSAADPTVANAARHHYINTDHANVPADLTPAVLQSPSRFGAYAASAMFATLPPVTPAPAPAAQK